MGIFSYARRSLALCLVIFLPCAAGVAHAALVEYDLTIDSLTVSEGGVPTQALAIDAQIPAPTLSATRGDTMRVTFTNRLDVAASIHWHGLLLPGDQDGVPYLNTAPILAGQSFTFEFPVIQSGTYWYHSHTDLQIQRGVYGSLVFREQELSDQGHAAHNTGHGDGHGGGHGGVDRATSPSSAALQEAVVLFSDWINEAPSAVLANLKKDDDYYAFKKNNVQSWDRVLAAGTPAISNRLNQSFTRMGPMDLADVAYDAFLANGQRIAEVAVADSTAAEIKLRLVNGSTSSYFDIEYAGGPMRIVAADGQAVEPLLVTRLRMATAETYDVIVPLVQGQAFELRATSIDGSGFSRTFVGGGTRVAAPTLPRPNLLLPMHSMASHEMSAQAEDHSGHGSGTHTVPSATVIEHLTDYAALTALEDTTLPLDRPLRTIPLALTGNMQRYVWGFDGLSQREDPRLVVQAGDRVRLELSNQTMMHHPIHLHGHFFRVINGQGARSPLKHTVDVPPMGSVTIEFSATENQDWLFHCHNQYHMKSGMNRVVSYVDSSTFDTPMADAILPARRWYSRNSLRGQSNVLGIDALLMDERHSLMLEADSSLKSHRDEMEVRASYSYQLTRFAAPFVSTEYREHQGADNETRVFAGLRIMLPLFIGSEWGVDDAGDARLELGSGLQLTRRVSMDWRWNTDNEHRYGVAFNLTKRTALTIGNDSEFGAGLGVSYLF